MYNINIERDIAFRNKCEVDGIAVKHITLGWIWNPSFATKKILEKYSLHNVIIFDDY